MYNWLYRILLLFSSAWITQENICDYLQHKNEFSVKNKRHIFNKAITEIDEAIAHRNATEIAIEQKIELKNVPINELLATFAEHETALRANFDQRQQETDRFIYGNGYDFLTILSRTLTSSQQQAMYSEICTKFMGDINEYLQNAKVCIHKL